MFNDWIKGWRKGVYWFGWVFGFLSILFWIILLGVWQMNNIGGKFWSKHTEAAVYYYGLVFLIFHFSIFLIILFL